MRGDFADGLLSRGRGRDSVTRPVKIVLIQFVKESGASVLGGTTASHDAAFRPILILEGERLLKRSGSLVHRGTESRVLDDDAPRCRVVACPLLKEWVKPMGSHHLCGFGRH